MTVAAALFWLSLAGVAYLYLGYPLLIGLRARWWPAPVAKGPAPADRCSVVVVAHNEAERIAAKVCGLVDADTSGRIEEIVVGLDGCTDDSEARLGALDVPCLRVHAFDRRRGKAAVLNELVPGCTAPLVVFNDARQDLEPGSLDRLLGAFADPRVGVVSGELVFAAGAGDSSAAKGLGVYWAYEKAIRRWEAAVHSVPGATGAFYALRRDLFRPVPPEVILDDVAIPMGVVLQGYRCVFEGDARVVDLPSQSAAQESVRKRRTIAGNAQLWRLYPGWSVPGRNPIWWQTLSHKFGRLASPVLLSLVLVSNFVLSSRPWYCALLALQTGFYLLAAAGFALQRRGVSSRVLGAVWMFVALNLTTVAALADAARGRFQPAWTRAAPT